MERSIVFAFFPQVVIWSWSLLAALPIHLHLFRGPKFTKVLGLFIRRPLSHGSCRGATCQAEPSNGHGQLNRRPGHCGPRTATQSGGPLLTSDKSIRLPRVLHPSPRVESKLFKTEEEQDLVRGCLSCRLCGEKVVLHRRQMERCSLRRPHPHPKEEPATPWNNASQRKSTHCPPRPLRSLVFIFVIVTIFHDL